MLSPYKLYKADKAVARKALTDGPKGRPSAGSKGSLCYRHHNVDWAVHRLAPALSNGPRRKKALGSVVALPFKGEDQEFVNKVKSRAGELLTKTSPRWGNGDVPGRKARKPVPLPDRSTVQVSKKTKVAAGGATVGGGAYAANSRRSSHQGVDKKKGYK